MQHLEPRDWLYILNKSVQLRGDASLQVGRGKPTNRAMITRMQTLNGSATTTKTANILRLRPTRRLLRLVLWITSIGYFCCNLL